MSSGKSARNSLQEVEFSWPYPKNKEELIQVAMVTLAVLFLGLVITAARFTSYKNQTLDAKSLKQSAANLASFATEAGQTVTYADGEVTQNYRLAHAEELEKQVEDTVSFVETRHVRPNLQKAAGQISSQGRQLSNILSELSEPPTESDHTNKEEAAKLHRAGQSLQNLQTSFERLNKQLEAEQ